MKKRRVEPEDPDDTTVRRVTSEMVTEISLEFQMRLFVELEKMRPAIAAKLKPDYEQWINLESAMQKETSGKFNFEDMVRRLPDNQWRHLLKEARQCLPFQSLKDLETGDYLAEKIAMRILGKDLC